MSDSTPLVSISCITYNHAPFIKRCLDGFLMQKTNIKFEVLIHDDASTDGTTEIIKEYENKYPDIIKPVYETENQWDKGRRGSVLFNFPRAKGKYIALCEGDDYWTDSGKLQRQVDFFESHPDYTVCFHPVKVVFEEGKESSYIHPNPNGKHNFTIKELLKKNFIQTNSVIYRRQNYDSLPSNILPFDWYLHLYHAQFGKIGFINKVMSVYRRHPGGLWWDSDRDIDVIWEKHGIAHLALYIEFQKLYGYKKEYKDIIDTHITNMLSSIIEVDKKTGSQLVKEAINNFPDYVEQFLMSQNNELEKRKAQLLGKEKKIEFLGQAEQHKDQLVRQKEQEIKMIKSSRFWKLRNMVARIVGKEII